MRSDYLWSQRTLREWGVGGWDDGGQEGHGSTYMNEHSLVTVATRLPVYVKTAEERAAWSFLLPGKKLFFLFPWDDGY